MILYPVCPALQSPLSSVAKAYSIDCLAFPEEDDGAGRKSAQVDWENGVL
ncbi:unnamed protein product [Natator depressus]